MKRILALLFGFLISFGILFFYWDFLVMRSEMSDQREDLVGVVRSVESNSMTISPWDMSEHPFRNLPLPEMMREFRLLTEAEKSVIREIMQRTLIPEVVIEIQEGQNMYKRLKQDSVRVQELEENSIVAIWWDKTSDLPQNKVAHIMVIPPELRAFSGAE